MTDTAHGTAQIETERFAGDPHVTVTVSSFDSNGFDRAGIEIDIETLDGLIADLQEHRRDIATEGHDAFRPVEPDGGPV